MIPSARSALTALFCTLALGLTTPGHADDDDPIDDLISQVVRENTQLADKQKKIDELSDQTDDLLAEWRAVQRRNKALQAYNAQLTTLVGAQQGELDGIRREIDQVSEISRQMTPLMLRMLSSLETFVALDMPFLIEERSTRMKDLRALMDRADVEESEKFRRILEAYQIENEYGRTIEAYRGTVKLADAESTVDILRIGRLVLVYATLDGATGGVWNRADKTWRPVSADQLRDIRTGLRMARKQAPPDLIRLPVPAPKPAERVAFEEAAK